MIQCTVEQSRAHFAKLADGGRWGDDFPRSRRLARVYAL
jgi:hypothetical protein